ncbi:MAG: M23 family metallopeptidase [Jatrophihabitans sp.]|uniref:M23 family metallopeptidase n=1 Tax=Jatrophihabitans sp. TaxID=1932789 RepID=UPI0039119D90
MGRHTGTAQPRRPSPYRVADPIPFAELRTRYDEVGAAAPCGRGRSRTRLGLMTAAASAAVIVTAAGVALATVDGPAAAHPRAAVVRQTGSTLGQGGAPSGHPAVTPSVAAASVAASAVAASATTTTPRRPVAKRRTAVRARWVDPLPGAPMTSCFCTRWGKFHDGIDLAAPLGTPIHAAGAGTVVQVGPLSGYGIAIFIRHSNGDVSFYGHMARVFVRLGQRVTAGQVIAPVGNEGFSTGPHLHFSVYRGGVHGPATDPKPWLAARGVKV